VSQVIEVSQGFPTDSPIFQPPERNRANEKPRYVSFIGSLIEPEIVTSRPWTRGGGIEVSNPCLRVVKNFIRKGRISPLLYDHHDFMSYDVARKIVGGDPFGAGYHPQPIPMGYVPPNLPSAAGELQPGFGSIAVGGPSPYGNLVFRWAFPGEQIEAVINGSENVTHTNIRRGIVEHKSLAGQDYRPQQMDDVYADPTLWEIQKTIFPDYPVLPVLLDDIERLLDVAEVHTLLRPIVDDDRESLIQFRDYADATIQNVHHTMRESAGRRGYVFRYTAMDLVLLEQLGMARQDRQIRQDAQASGNTKLEGMFEQWLAIQIEERKANLDRMKRTGEVPEINDSTMMAQPLEAGDAGQEGASGTSGYSGASGEVVATATPEGQGQMAASMADTEPQYDLDSPRPEGMHHKTWEKMRRDAGKE